MKIRDGHECILALNYGIWDSLKRGVHHFCLKMSERNPIIYVHSPSQLSEYNEGPNNIPKLKEVHHNIYELTWPWWCREVYRYRALEAFLKKMRSKIIGQVMQKRGFKAIDFIYVTQPMMYGYIENFAGIRKVCHIFDQYSFYDHDEDREIVKIEQKYLPQFDAVVCVSDKLCQEKKKYNKNTYQVPHGVDYDLFANATGIENNKAVEIPETEKPVIGYIGSISGKVDLDLIYYLAGKRRDWIFVLIGPTQLNARDSLLFSRLRSCTNFVYIGFRPPNLLPLYMNRLDVGLMPYRLEGHVPWGFPLKMFEYMAAGIPSVAAPLESIASYEKKGVMRIARSKAEWIEFIEESIEESKEESLITQRKRMASKNTWDESVRKFLAILDG